MVSKTGTPKHKARKESSEEANVLATRGSLGAAESGEAKTVLLREWERLFPEANHVEELNPDDRKFWIRFRQALLQSHQGVATLTKVLGESISKELSAEIADREERRVAEIRDVDELRAAKIRDLDARRKAEIEIEKKTTKADLDERRQQREGEEGRKKMRLAQEISERERFLLLTTIGFAATFVLVAISAFTRMPLGYASSGLSLLLSCGSLYRLMVLSRHAEATSQEKQPATKRKKRKRKG
jgi:hypothetical protein